MDEGVYDEVKVTITTNVTSCMGCPHFDNGPHEMACTLYEKQHGVYSSMRFLHRPHSPKNGKHIGNSIPDECPAKP